MLVKRRSNLPRKIFKTLLFLAVVSAFSYAFFFSPIFKIQSVDIVGTGATKDEINQFIGEDTVGSNILLWRPRAVGANQTDGEDLTKRLASISIARNFMTRKIVVSIKGRDKELIWCYTKADECFWTDKNGVIFESAPKTSGNLIHLVNDQTERSPQTGDSTLDAEMFSNLIKIFKIMDNLKLSAEDVSVEDVRLRELNVLLSGGPKIIFGLNIAPDFTETTLSSLKQDGWKGVGTVNLTVYGRAYTSP